MSTASRDMTPDMAGLLQHPDPLALHPVHEQSSSVRRISASFSTDEPLSCQPSLATSGLTASKIPTSRTLGTLPRLPTLPPLPTGDATPKSSRRFTPRNLPLPRPSIFTTYSTAVAPPHCPPHDENMSPPTWVDGLGHKHKNSIDLASIKLGTRSRHQPLSSISKSSTLNVITNLTASLSRNSLSKFSGSTSFSSTSESEPRGSLTSDSSAALLGGDTGDTGKIYAAQPSAYWTGRFVALRDRFRNEMLLPENMSTLLTAQAERSMVAEDGQSLKASHLPTSVSNPNFIRTRVKGRQYSASNATKVFKAPSKAVTNSLEAARLEDDDNRARRIFVHLDALCATSEARHSLHAWQQTYARRMGKENLLPEGGTMDDKGWVGRLLKRGSRDGKRTSATNIA